jgi:anti-sigma factor ChrR (cupin superfamily)
LLERIAPGSTSKNELKLVRASDSPWVALGAPGVEVRPLLGRKTLLVRMQPGAAFPEHEHRQVEQCYVLEGSVTDSDGITAYAGDFVCMPADITHTLIHTDTGCVFLIAYTN